MFNLLSFSISNMLKFSIIWSIACLLCQFPSLAVSRWPYDQRLSSGHHQNKLPTTEPLKVINIGAVLESSESIGQFFQAIEEVNMEPNVLPPGISLYAISSPASPNPVRMVHEFCEKMIKSEVYAVVIDDADSPEAAVISQTCDFLNIPVIGLSNRNSYLSDTHMHSVYLRTVPPYSHQVDVWIEMLNTLNYSHVVFIHGADYGGRTTFIRFQGLAEKSGIQIRSVIEYETGVTDIVDELEEADEEIQCRVYLLYANELEAQSIFLEVLRLNMTSPGYVWIVSEAALRATNVPDGVLALQLFNANNRASHIVDSIYIIGLAIRDMIPIENVTRPPSKCGDLTANSWETGSTFYNYLRKQFLLYGKTGRVAFDGKGDRIDAEYEVINRVRGRSVSIGQYAFSQSKMKMHLTLNINEIIWPGYQTTQPLGYVRPSHLRIVTIEEEPFIFFHPVSKAEECVGDTVPCGKIDVATGMERMYCCSGYCIDFLVDLARRLNFTYTLYQVADGVYGNFEHVNGTDQPKVWTGLVGDLIYKKADMIVAPLTINPERSLYIEFSKPFKYQGITILEKKLPKRAGLASFLQPFEESLWLLVMLSVHVVALALYLLDRFSPFGRYKLPNSDVTEEDALNLSSAIWFAWGVLLNSGIGEGTPRSFSGRVLGMVWCGCAMIVIASYTANLAAFLVLERPTTSLTGINDARLRNPTTSFTYATVKASSVEMYFKRQVELKEMYEYMIDKNYPTVEDGVAAVKNDEISAFIWDSARLEWEAAKDCDLITAAEQFGRSGYGIGLVKNSFWTDQMNSAILSMHESGFMTDLDNKWILSEDIDVICLNRYDPVPTTLGLRNMAGVFILLGAGIFGGIALIVIEVVYKKRQVAQQKQLENARSASEKWKRFVQKRRLYRANIHALRQEQLRQEHLRSEKIFPAKYESEQPNRDDKMNADSSSNNMKRVSTSSQHTVYHQQGTGQKRSQQRTQTLSFEPDHQPQHHHYDNSHHQDQPFTVERGLTEMKMEENRKMRKEEPEEDCKMITPPSEYQRGYYQDQSKMSGSLRSTTLSPPPLPLSTTVKFNQASGQLQSTSSPRSSHYSDPLMQHLPQQKQPPSRPLHQIQPQHFQPHQQAHYQKPPPPPPPPPHQTQHQFTLSSHAESCSSSTLPTSHGLHHHLPPHVPPHQTHPRSLHQGYTASVTPSLSRSAPSSVEIEMAKSSLRKGKQPKETISSSSVISSKSGSKSSETSRKRFLKRESSMNYERGSTPDSYTRGGDSRRGTPSPNQGHLIKPPHALVYSSRPQDFNFSYGYTN